MMPLENRYITLSDGCSLRLLETPCVYSKVADRLYEVGADKVEFLKKCDGSATVREVGGDPEFLSYCLEEGILATLPLPHRRYFNLAPPPAASLRYLELHITSRCNMRCRHCYLDAGEGADLELMKAFKVFDEFDGMQGLRMLISGGEPMLHKGFWYINERMSDYGFRSVLLTNGSLVTKEAASRLKFHEAKVSIDGMPASHDALRGDGSFKKAVQGVENLTSAGIRVRAATVVTALNKGEMDDMRMLMESLGVAGWTVDAPSLAGRFIKNPELMLSPEEAAPYLAYGTDDSGGCHQGSPAGHACGAHLLSVGPRGQVARCGFYLDRPAGDIKDGLRQGWEGMARVKLDRLACDCDHVEECGGGCRFRASTYSGEHGPDPVRCRRFGVDPSHMKGGGD